MLIFKYKDKGFEVVLLKKRELTVRAATHKCPLIGNNNKDMHRYSTQQRSYK